MPCGIVQFWKYGRARRHRYISGCADVIASGDYQGLGEMMDISHNGDHVWKNGMPYIYSASDSYLKGLIRNLKDGVSIERSRIINWGGGNACSHF